MTLFPVRILSTGSCVPDRVVTNAELQAQCGQTDEWIVQRTGIQERRIADSNTAASDLAIVAAERAMKSTNIDAAEIDLILVATITPDMTFPTTACFVQKGIGASNAAAFDLVATCSGFIYGLATAKAFIESGMFRTVLLIGVDVLSRITDWEDSGTCVLFGDGAGAMLLQRGASGTSSMVLSAYLGADGTYDKVLNLPGGGSRHPATHETVNARMHYMKMQGKEVFKVAVPKMAQAAETALKAANKTVADMDLLIPHQANLRIIEAVGKRLNLPADKVYVNVRQYGNMSAASTIVALDAARSESKVADGSLVCLAAFGGGFTWGAVVLQF